MLFFNILKLVEDLDVKSHWRADFSCFWLPAILLSFSFCTFPFTELSGRSGEPNFHCQEEVNLYDFLIELLIDASFKKKS